MLVYFRPYNYLWHDWLNIFIIFLFFSFPLLLRINHESFYKNTSELDIISLTVKELVRAYPQQKNCVCFLAPLPDCRFLLMHSLGEGAVDSSNLILSLRWKLGFLCSITVSASVLAGIWKWSSRIKLYQARFPSPLSPLPTTLSLPFSVPGFPLELIF